MSASLAGTVYVACFLASALCAVLLVRQHLHQPSPVLLWSAACFVLLAFSNLIVVVDVMMLPTMNLRPARLVLTLLAVSVLLFGFIWEAERN